MKLRTVRLKINPYKDEVSGFIAAEYIKSLMILHGCYLRRTGIGQETYWRACYKDDPLPV